MVYANALMTGHVKAAEPNFQKSFSGLSHLLTVLERNPNDRQEVQKALDGLSLETARKYRAALKYCIDELCGSGVSVYYLHVGEFGGSVNQTHGHISKNSSAEGVVYTSPIYRAAARVYWIAADPGTFEVGFMQQCNGKNQRATFADGSVHRLVLTGAGTFPIGDSSAPADYPFYFRNRLWGDALAHKCEHPTAMMMEGIVWGQWLEINDYFRNNGVRARNGQSLLQSFLRDQSFSCWLGVFDVQAQAVRRLYHRQDYSISLSFERQAQTQTIVSVKTSDSRAHRPEAILAGEALPNVGSPVMNGMEGWVNG